MNAPLIQPTTELVPLAKLSLDPILFPQLKPK
jgi:hypothetical protein